MCSNQLSYQGRYPLERDGESRNLRAMGNVPDKGFRHRRPEEAGRRLMGYYLNIMRTPLLLALLTASPVIHAQPAICDELEAGFSWTTTTNGTQFSNATAGTGFQTTWYWTFGDGTSSDNAQPFHTYPEPGVYEVCLVAISIFETNDGPFTCLDTTCAEVVIEGNNPCDELAACFAVDAVDNDSFVLVNCTQPSTNVQYVWHFGDGANGSGVNAEHSYAEPGTYEVCLVAYWNNCEDEFCTTVTVTGGGNVCDELEAGFSWTTTPNGTQFSNATAGTGFQTTWTWYFGDGNSSTDAQPFHTYSEPGTYLVCLVAVSAYETSGGVITCMDKSCEEIEINVGGCAPFVVEFTWSAEGPAVVFNANASMNVNGYLWFFGDGTQGDGQTTTHLYEPPGPYTVCVAAWYWNTATQDSCWAEHCAAVDPFEVGVTETFGSRIHVFPVPANEQLIITGLQSPADLRLLAADGRMVLFQRTGGAYSQLDVSPLAAGTYALEIVAGGVRSVRRIVIE